MTIWPLAIFALFGALCVFWLGNVTINLRKENERLMSLVEKLTSTLRNAALDQAAPQKELPDYIPMSDGQGGFYKMPDGTWRAETGPKVIHDSPLGGRSTTETVDGVWPSVEDIDVEEEV